uniref:Uncharacterized protein n=1 Tax=Anguilla anguilla TaxID=7936 RepID=A0A0E9VRS4_ANGAN
MPQYPLCWYFKCDTFFFCLFLFEKCSLNCPVGGPAPAVFCNA